MSIDQGKLYDGQYDEGVFDHQGLPDLKITNYQQVRGRKILSIGCGMGADLWFLTESNSVYGIDLSGQAIQIAKKHGLNARAGDVTKRLPYQANYFDTVVLKDILEHVLDPLSLLLEARRVVKKGGTIVISLPNHFWWWFRLRILLGKNLLWKTWQHDHSKDQHEWDYMHVRFFTWSGVKDFIAKADLTLKRAYWDFGTLAHYSEPEMFANVLRNKSSKSAQARLFLDLLYPMYLLFNSLFPKKWRARFVGINPGFWCAGFYLHLHK